MSDVSIPSNVSDLTIKVLEKIHDEIRGLRGEVVAMRGDLNTLTSRVDVLSDRVETGFAAVNLKLGELRVEAVGTNRRLDAVLKITGTHHGELEDRVTRIETHLGLPAGG